MAAKLIQISDDSEVTWETFPGGTGDINLEAGEIPDTIFGQTFNSAETGIINWSINAQAFYKGFAGYKADLKKQGTSTAFTTEAMSLVSGKTYRIDDDTKSIWNRAQTLTVFDNAVDHTADVESVNYLFGEVTFKAAYTPTTPITVTGEYFPTAVLGQAQSFTLTQTVDPIRTTTFESAQANGGYDTFDPGLRSVGLSLSGVYALASGFKADLVARNEIVIEVNPDGNGATGSRARGFFRLASQVRSGDVGALEEESVEFNLNVPAPASAGVSNVTLPFDWQHAGGSTIPEAVKIALTAFTTEAKMDGRYLGDGVAGDKGAVVITEATLGATLDGMNEFTVTMQGDGVLTAV